MQGGFSKSYNTIGVDKFYEQNGSNYVNPHQYDIQRFIKKRFRRDYKGFIHRQSKILDLACGSGEVTLALKSMGYDNIEGLDPYTYQIYQKKTGIKCDRFTFVDIVQGCLDQRRYDAIIISYALHLVKDSMLHDFCRKLTQLTQTLIVIAPHKFPIMKDNYGWKEVQLNIRDKIHIRIFKSFQSIQNQQPKKITKITRRITRVTRVMGQGQIDSQQKQ